MNELRDRLLLRQELYFARPLPISHTTARHQFIVLLTRAALVLSDLPKPRSGYL